MAESMKGLKRTHRCGELSAANIGEKVTVMGWVQKQRNKGGIIFVDLRDRAGILQVIFEEADGKFRQGREASQRVRDGSDGQSGEARRSRERESGHGPDRDPCGEP